MDNEIDNAVISFFYLILKINKIIKNIMSKESDIKRLELHISNLDSKILEYKYEILNLKSQKELSISQLILEFENGQSEFLVKTISQKRYNHILGGDGNHSAWDEPRNGLVLSIFLLNCYISKEDLIKFMAYLMNTKTRDIKAILINDQQEYPSIKWRD